MNARMKSLRSLVLMVVVGAFPAFLSSQANPSSLNVGVAQVNGRIRLVASNPAASLADFTLALADTGTLQTKIAFKSTLTVLESDVIDVIGDLTLTILERSATDNPSSGKRSSQTAAYPTRSRRYCFAISPNVRPAKGLLAMQQSTVT